MGEMKNCTISFFKVKRNTEVKVYINDTPFLLLIKPTATGFLVNYDGAVIRRCETMPEVRRFIFVWASKR